MEALKGCGIRIIGSNVTGIRCWPISLSTISSALCSAEQPVSLNYMDLTIVSRVPRPDAALLDVTLKGGESLPVSGACSDRLALPGQLIRWPVRPNRAQSSRSHDQMAPDDGQRIGRLCDKRQSEYDAYLSSLHLEPTTMVARNATGRLSLREPWQKRKYSSWRMEPRLGCW
jgi:hypothetical protein